MNETSWRIRWTEPSGKSESLTTDSLNRAQDVVLDLLRREVDFQVITFKPDRRTKR